MTCDKGYKIVLSSTPMKMGPGLKPNFSLTPDNTYLRLLVNLAQIAICTWTQGHSSHSKQVCLVSKICLSPTLIPPRIVGCCSFYGGDSIVDCLLLLPLGVFCWGIVLWCGSWCPL